MALTKHLLFIFLDGIGLGEDDPATNPFAVANMPLLHDLAGGRWLKGLPRSVNGRASFVPTDACLGVPGRPQSATGQAALLTGRNVAAEIGMHYGPRPNPEVRAIIAEDNLFKQVVAHGDSAALVDAYPPGFFSAVERGKRLLSSIQQAVHEAGIPLMDDQALRRGEAFSPDWTGEGWRAELGYSDTPVYTPEEAGRRLGAVATQRTLTMFSTWITDVIGHRGPFERGVALLERFDRVMAGLLAGWPDDGLIVISSDHGNMEDLGSRRHTENPVPTLIVGRDHAAFADGLTDLVGVTPHILKALYG